MKSSEEKQKSCGVHGILDEADLENGQCRECAGLKRLFSDSDVQAVKPLHVDDWLDTLDATYPNPGEAYARWFLEYHRLPAWKKTLYAHVMAPFKLFCDYNGIRVRCTGASRMGDVWLVSDMEKSQGYNFRVNVEECSNWSATP